MDRALLPIETDAPASGSRMTVDLAALVVNWRALAAMAGGAETAAAVKGDAYGIGLDQAARALSRAGCRTFFVALPLEGLVVRRVAPDATVYVLNGLAPGEAATLAASGLRPVLGSLAEIREWSAFRNSGGRGLAALHVDTGMNRLGLTVAEAASLAGRAEDWQALGLTLVMSHLACADTRLHPLNARQLADFRAVAQRFEGLPASLANSAGIELGPDYHFDLVRPGIALYGGRFAQDRAPLQTVATVEARILQIRDVAAGETVGYGAAERLKRASRIAILSAGYADGYHRSASSTDAKPGASTFVHGRRAPLCGRISMDLIAIDVTDIPAAARGDWVELFGAHVGVDEVAQAAGTIGYEFLTSLGRRHQRLYRGGA